MLLFASEKVPWRISLVDIQDLQKKNRALHLDETDNHKNVPIGILIQSSKLLKFSVKAIGVKPAVNAIIKLKNIRVFIIQMKSSG